MICKLRIKKFQNQLGSQTNFSVQNIVLKNYDNQSDVINLTVIMQFIENSTDFKLSFSKSD